MKLFRRILFLILGIVLQQLVHHIIERVMIELLIRDFEKYNLGLTWDQWFWVHHIGSFVLLGLGIWFGLWLGNKFDKK